MTALADRLGGLQARIDAALAGAARPPGTCRLLAVAKTRHADEIRALAALGVRDIGENYVQEARVRMDALADLELSWHLIGPLQSNKTAEVAARFAWVHSVDRLKIARRLSEHRPARLPPLNVCLQVNIDDEDSKHGVALADVETLALTVADMPGLRLRGLMAIPRPDQSPGPDNAFARLAKTLDALAARIPGLDTLSMGMSDDFEQAIGHGATWVRIGTALFGPRPAPSSITPGATSPGAPA